MSSGFCVPQVIEICLSWLSYAKSTVAVAIFSETRCSFKWYVSVPCCVRDCVCSWRVSQVSVDGRCRLQLRQPRWNQPRHGLLSLSLLFMPLAVHTHTRLTALFPGLPGWAGTRKVKPIWISLKQETVSGSGHMQVCTSLQTDNHASTPPVSFYRPDALPATQPTASKHWRP